MSPADLHPSLDGDVPLPKPVCVGCRSTPEQALLVPLRHAPSVFICGACAGCAHVDVFCEHQRRVAAAILGIDAAQTTRAGT